MMTEQEKEKVEPIKTVHVCRNCDSDDTTFYYSFGWVCDECIKEIDVEDRF